MNIYLVFLVGQFFQVNLVILFLLSCHPFLEDPAAQLQVYPDDLYPPCIQFAQELLIILDYLAALETLFLQVFLFLLYHIKITITPYFSC